MALWVPAQYRAELLHAAMQIDSHGTVRHTGASRYFRTGQALDQSQDQCLSIGVGQAPDRIEDCGGRAFMFSTRASPAEIFVRRIIREWILWHRTPVVVIRQIAGDRRQPTPKASDSRSVESRRSALKKTSCTRSSTSPIGTFASRTPWTIGA